MDTTAIEHFLSGVDFTGDCWVWTKGRNTEGYGYLQYLGERWGVHRLSYTLFVGPIPPGILVLHHCDTPSCIRPTHLFLGTDSDNIQDMLQKGRGHGQQKNALRQRPCLLPR